MQLFARPHQALVAIALLYCPFHIADASTIAASAASSTSSVLPTTSQPLNGTCESRTINYITHSLPKICLRYLRSDLPSPEPTNATAAETAGTQLRATLSGSVNEPAEATSSAEGAAVLDPDTDSALDESSFLSFEDWKKQRIEKEGIQTIKDGERRRHSDGIQDALKALEEDVELDADFSAFLGERHADSASKGLEDEDSSSKSSPEDMADAEDTEEKSRYRSKDAGKTCKERFNFASLDAGAQVMKTNPEAKSASALLKEDRDVYMLNTCQAKNKFLIVELSESIQVETVAIANFEFFSSTFRQFRIGGSDRYPVKLDRWVDLGTFEARNSRDIQAFLIEKPRIWARYLRVEFLSHYGNEFYCPVSLLRVHGRTMIEEAMEEALRGEDDIEDDVEDVREEDGEVLAPDAIAEVLEEEYRVAEGVKEVQAAIEELVRTSESITSSKPKDTLKSSQITDAKQELETVPMEHMITPWIKLESALMDLFYVSDICLPSESPASITIPPKEHSNGTVLSGGAIHSPEPSPPPNDTGAALAASASSSSSPKQVNEMRNITEPQASTLPSAENASGPVSSARASTSRDAGVSSVMPGSTSTGVNKLSNKSSATAAHSPQPTTQESFFKTVTKRLQLLEANSTLSLKYIEEQSRILRDAFTKVEKKQLAKTTCFLENLNKTVLEELRKFSQQYDQIWQSTVLELETQRDQSQREITAVSMRLSILADELVFQKRMSVVQSVLLILCLGMVIFSRGPAGGYLDVPIIQNMVLRSRNAPDAPFESLSSSPAPPRISSPLKGRPWVGAEHRRQRSDESARSFRSQSQEDSPPTPFSTYSRQEEESKEDNEYHDLLKGVQTGLTSGSSPSQDASGLAGGPKPNPMTWTGGNFIPEKISSTTPPDFTNSALWIAPDPLIAEPERINVQRYVEEQSGGERQSPIYDTYGSGNQGTSNMHISEQQIGVTISSPGLPSPPADREKPEFSIARKPLPALPKDQ